jgi:hypothetical protein
MKKRLLLSLFLGLLWQASIAQQTNATDELLAFEQARVEATLKANVAQLEAMLADELVWVHSNGKIDSKTSYIQDIANQKSRCQALQVLDSKARIYGEIGLTNGRLLVEFFEEDNSITKLTVLFTVVYRQQAGQWQVISWQTTKLN